MNWLLPLAFVFIAGLVMAVAHFLFVRWMTRLSAPTEGEARKAGKDTRRNKESRS